MKELLRKFENLWVSVAFAEAGEYAILRQPSADETANGEVCQAS